MDTKRILIVGGVAGGASAAARLRRLSEDAEIILFERSGNISFANCGLPYHIGEVITDRDRLLVQTPAAMKSRFNIDVRVLTEVVSIDRDKKQVVARNLVSGEEYTEAYDKLVLSPGAAPVSPPIPGADSDRVFTLRNIEDMDAIKKVVDNENTKSAVVIGAGYIGIEMAEALVHRGIKVSLVEMLPQVFAPVDPEIAAPLADHMAMHGVDLRLNTSVTGIKDNDGTLEVELSEGAAIKAALAIMAIGARPESKLAVDAGLELGSLKGIAVNENMQTSDADIYAVGDAVEVIDFVSGKNALIPLAGPANRQGRIAADNIFGRPSTYKHTQGTAICKVFDLAVGITGQSEKALKRNERAYETIYVHPSHHAGYYPGAAQMTLKLIFDPKDGTILGAQAVGPKGIDKRIDVIAVAIRAGLKVFDLADLELSYAPPFGSAKDAVNYAGFVASNVINGDMPICHVDDILNPGENQAVLDVRTTGEFECGTIPGAINIPVDLLRDSLGDLDKSKEYLVTCAVGIRGYLATRILMHNGFKARNLTGGYKTFKAFTGGANKEQTEMSKTEPVNPVCKLVEAGKPEITKTIDATGLQCPGPIMKLKSELETIEDGQAVCIVSTDPGFTADIAGWCNSTGNRFGGIETGEGTYKATVIKGATSAMPVQGGGSDLSKNKTIVVFSNDFDKAMAAFIIANGAASMGSEVTLFFTFWGLNLLRRDEAVPVKKNLIEKMFGMMMPRGAKKTVLSKMNMMGMGTKMMQGIMRKKNVASLSELIDSARENGVRLVACTMSMDLMGIKKAELIDGIEEGGVAMYLNNAEKGNVNLFI
ncbi:MAG: FAD-dependent oxidoreductase [Phycisphaerae bacterium]|nr:FAD-dependent oxidoreductase [Phycisphaerae bacterium]